jgi:hypothetical protein
MLKGTTLFVDALGRWVAAIETSDIGKARAIAEHLEVDAQRLVLIPEFHQCLEKHFDGMSADKVLQSLSQFLLCATNARALALKQHGS